MPEVGGDGGIAALIAYDASATPSAGSHYLSASALITFSVMSMRWLA
jgi:hypothetical protein